jgi:hypothetical protein
MKEINAMKIGLIKWLSKNDSLTQEVKTSLGNKYNYSKAEIDDKVNAIFNKRYQFGSGWLEASRKSAIKSTLKEVIREHKTQTIAKIVCGLTPIATDHYNNYIKTKEVAGQGLILTHDVVLKHKDSIPEMKKLFDEMIAYAANELVKIDEYNDSLTVDEIKLTLTKANSIRDILLENDVIESRRYNNEYDLTPIVNKSTSKDLIKRFDDRLLFKKHEKCYLSLRKKFDFRVPFSESEIFNSIENKIEKEKGEGPYTNFAKEGMDRKVLEVNKIRDNRIILREIRYSEEKTKKLFLKFDAIFIDDLQNNLVNHFNDTEQKIIIDVMRKREQALQKIKTAEKPLSWGKAFINGHKLFIDHVQMSYIKKDDRHELAALNKLNVYLNLNYVKTGTLKSHFEKIVDTAYYLRKYDKSEFWNNYTLREKEFIDLMIDKI